MVVIDSSILLLTLQPGASAPLDAAGNAIQKAAERVDYLIERLGESGEHIAIPSPVLAETLVGMRSHDATAIVDTINKQSSISVLPFDQRAAIELSAMVRKELSTGPKKKKLKKGPDTWAKVKFDRQIVAIAKVNKASVVFTADKRLSRAAVTVGLSATLLEDLPTRPIDPQAELPFGGA